MNADQGRIVDMPIARGRALGCRACCAGRFGSDGICWLQGKHLRLAKVEVGWKRFAFGSDAFPDGETLKGVELNLAYHEKHLY
jgi:hypothetical protein